MRELVRVAGVRELVALMDGWASRGVFGTVGLWRLRTDRAVRLLGVGLPPEWRPPARPSEPWTSLEEGRSVAAPGIPGCALHLLRRGDEVAGLGLFPEELDPELIAGLGETLGRCLAADEALVRSKLLDHVLALVADGVISATPDGDLLALSESLVNVRNVASVHGGAVGVVNDGGAVIDLWLPLSSRPELTLTRSSSGAQGDGLRVWIVDDQEAVLEFARVSLEAHGCAVEAWADADGARRSVARGARSPDLLVLDVQLATTDGITLWRELVAAGVGCPVLWITGHTPETLQVPEGSGPVLQKPFTGADLVGAVDRLMGG